jgi:hypothetical protein
LLIDAEGHLWVGRSNEVSELVGYGELLLLDPVLYQIELVLLNDRSGELDGLDGVQLGGLQEGVEIDEDRGWSSGRRQVLELVNGFLVSQKGSWGVSGDRSCTSVVTGGKLLVEHKDEEIVGSGEVEPLGQLERELLVARNVTGRVDVRDKIVLFDVDRVDLSSAVDHDHAVSLFVSSSDEAELVCYLLSVEERGGGDLVHVKEAHLCDNEDDTVLWAVLHQHREVSCLLHLEISRSLHFLLSWSRVADFHDVELLSCLTSLLFTEAEDVVLVVGGVGHWHVGEASGETLEDLLLSFLGQEKLHVAADGLIGSLVDTNEVAPFLG